jgi:hypothetical protein
MYEIHTIVEVVIILLFSIYLQKYILKHSEGHFPLEKGFFAQFSGNTSSRNNFKNSI